MNPSRNPGIQPKDVPTRRWDVVGRGAFTLLELLVVIALIGIASLMLVPEMRGSYQDAVLRAACRELVDAFQLAYSRAVSFNQDHRVRIDPRAGRYVIEASRSPLAGRATEFRPLKGVKGCEGELDKRIRVSIRQPSETAEDAAIPLGLEPEERFGHEGPVFYADGTATACEAVLSDQQGFRIELAVSPVTGRVRIGEVQRR